MGYYLGVDGGGSKTNALLTDECGNILGVGRSGNGNHQLDYEEARTNIRQAVEQALADAGIRAGEVDSACFGLSGADREADFRILRPMIAELGLPRHEIVCDTMIGLRAGTSRASGVVLICGTGTNSAGRNEAGDVFQCGGFSYPYGDFGGGGALCVEALRTVIRAWDGREDPTLLTPLVLKDLGYATVEEMYNDYLDHDRLPPNRLTKLLFEAAAQGDAASIAILNRQGVELGKSAASVIRRLGMEEQEFDVVLVGSVLTRGQGHWVTEPIQDVVRRLAPRASIVKLSVEPVVGAAWSAYEATGLTLTEEWYAKLGGISDFESISPRRGAGQ